MTSSCNCPIRPGNKIRHEFFAFDKFTLQNIAKKSGCVETNLLYHWYITSEVNQYYEALFLSYRSWIESSISQLCNTNGTHSILRTMEVRVGFSAKPLKKFPKSAVRPSSSHFCSASCGECWFEWTLTELRSNIIKNLLCLFSLNDWKQSAGRGLRILCFVTAIKITRDWETTNNQ